MIPADILGIKAKGIASKFIYKTGVKKEKKTDK